MQYKNKISGILRCIFCLLVITLTMDCWSLDATTTSIRPATAPVVGDPLLSFRINNGILQNTAASAGSADNGLSVSGFYTTSTTPTTTIDQQLHLPMLNSAAGLTTPQNQQTGGSADALMNLRMAYRTKGLSFSASMNETGSDVFNYADAVKKLALVDAAGANSLSLGTKKLGYDLNYSGISGMSFSSKINTVTNELAGNGENGLTRTLGQHGVGLALGSQYRMEYQISRLTEVWDPTTVKRDSREVDTNLLKLSGNIGKQSAMNFSNGQTHSNCGASQTDTTERNYSLKWNEWKGITLAGNYNTKSIEQTHEDTSILNLEVTATPLRGVKLMGKLTNNSRMLPGMLEAADNNFRQLRIDTTLSPYLQLKNEYVTVSTPSNGDTTTLNNQATLTLSPTWTANMLMGSTERSLIGSEKRLECGLKGMVGPKGKQATVLLQSGRYDLGISDKTYNENLLSVQLLGYRPLSSTSISLGFYDGPLLMGNSMVYRSWGTRPSANGGAWRDLDFARYHELGGEITQTLDAQTKLVAKQVNSETEQVGVQTMSEYGIERKIGKGTIQLGRTYTHLPDGTQQQGTVWNLRLPFTGQLPGWAGKTLQGTVFQDGAAWGFGQLPTWVTSPTSGMTVGQKISQLNNVAIQDQSVSLGGMTGDDLYLQAGYQRNPKPVLALGDPGDRLMLHSACAISPGLQLIGRYLQETLTDKAAILITRSLGVMGNISPTTQLQLQVNWLTQRSVTTTDDGVSYQLQFARTINASNSLVVKYRLLPDSFRGALLAQQVDVGFKLSF